MDAPVGKEYAGPSGIGRDSIWLTAEDLVEGRDVEVKIEHVILYPLVEFEKGRTRSNMLGLKFVGKARQLGLNSTNRKSLNKMFGNIVKAWSGQEITLYVSEAQIGGEKGQPRKTVKCVRIRDRGARAATAAEEFLHESDEPQAFSAYEAGPASPEQDTATWLEFAAFVKDAQVALGRRLIEEQSVGSGIMWTIPGVYQQVPVRLYDVQLGKLVCGPETLTQVRGAISELLMVEPEPND